MDILDHPVNKRIMNGCFPIEKLYPSDIEAGRTIDFNAKAKMGMTLLSENPELLSFLFINFGKKAAEFDSLNRLELYKRELNYYINARCSDDYLIINGSLQNAYNLIPVITPLDKVLWFGAQAYQMEIEINDDPEYDPESMMFAWIRLLDLAQEMELKTQRTVDISKVDHSTNLLELIRGGFKKTIIRNRTRELTNSEYSGLKRLNNQRKSLLSIIYSSNKLSHLKNDA